MSDLLTTWLMALGVVGAIISAIWVSWPVGLLTLVAVGILYWTREIAYGVAEISDHLNRRNEP